LHAYTVSLQKHCGLPVNAQRLIDTKALLR
jgi:hypothetical protein